MDANLTDMDTLSIVYLVIVGNKRLCQKDENV